MEAEERATEEIESKRSNAVVKFARCLGIIKGFLSSEFCDVFLEGDIQSFNLVRSYPCV